VPEGCAIIKGRAREVNGEIGPRRCTRRVLATIVLLLAAGGMACSDERRAERGYRQAMALVEGDDLARAVERFDEIARRFPQTEAGRRALRDAKLYRGLIGAVENFPASRARDAIVAIARAVEAQRGRDRHAPASLADLDAGLPPVDPWGNPFGYERSADGRGYRLTCYGSDGTTGGEGDAADIVVENGAFRREPRR